MKRYLVIDGNYFAQRVIAQLNMGNNVNNLETEIEKNSFKNALYASLISLYRTFVNDRTNLIEDVLFCIDSGSWRKDVEFVPYWFDTLYTKEQRETIPTTYKGQRKVKKEESPINFDNFYALFREFYEEICKIGVKGFSVPKLEGDDLIGLIAWKIRHDSEKFAVIFATDGDLEQVVAERVVLFKNIKSKDAPNGELVVEGHDYTKITCEVDYLKDSFRGDWLQSLTSVVIGDTSGASKVTRKLNEGIRIAKPHELVMKKSICGDAKDNIFSPISWLSSTGTRKYGISKKHFERALERLQVYLNPNRLCAQLGYDAELREKWLRYIYEETKQELTEEQYKKYVANFYHNLSMNEISIRYIPKNLQEEFDKLYEENVINRGNELFPVDEIEIEMRKQITPDQVSSVYADSIEDILSDIIK